MPTDIRRRVAKDWSRIEFHAGAAGEIVWRRGLANRPRNSTGTRPRRRRIARRVHRPHSYGTDKTHSRAVRRALWWRTGVRFMYSPVVSAFRSPQPCSLAKILRCFSSDAIALGMRKSLPSSAMSLQAFRPDSPDLTARWLQRTFNEGGSPLGNASASVTKFRNQTNGS